MILREIFASFGLDLDSASFAEGTAAANLMEKAAEKIVDVFMEMVRFYPELVHQTAEWANEMSDTAVALGLSTDELQRWHVAAAKGSVEAEVFNGAVTRLTKNMALAKDGAKKQAAAFAQLGVKFTDAEGHLRPVSDVLMDLTEALPTVENDSERVATAMRLMGTGGAKMLTMMEDGLDEVQKNFREATIMTEEQIKAGDRLAVTLKEIDKASPKMLRMALAPMLPILEQMAKRWLKFKKEFLATIQPWVAKALAVVTYALNGVSYAIEFLWKNAVFLKAALVGLVVYFGLVNAAAVGAAIAATAAWIAAAAPFVAIAAAIGVILLLLDDIRGTMTGEYTGNTLTKSFKNFIDEMMAPKEDDFGFVVAIKSFYHWIMESIPKVREFGAAIAEKFDTFQKIVNMLPPVILAKMAYGAAVNGEQNKRDVVNRGASMFLGRSPMSSYQPSMSSQPGYSSNMSMGPAQSTPMAGGKTIVQHNQYNVNADGLTKDEAMTMMREVAQQSIDDAHEDLVGGQSR